MSNVRTERIKAQIIRDISEIIQFEVTNKDVGFVTVTDAQVSDDYSHAWIYVSFFDKARTEVGLKALNTTKSFIRTALAKRMSMRKTPELHFLRDELGEKAERLEEILKKTKKSTQ